MFTLEPLGAEANSYELRARLQWTPGKSKSPKKLGITADPTSIELITLSTKPKKRRKQVEMEEGSG